MDTSKEYIEMCRKANGYLGTPIYTQEQLQDMLFQPLGKTFVYWLDRFYKYVENQERHESMIGGCYSMEQLWLAFVMHEKYGKTWDGKDWNPM